MANGVKRTDYDDGDDDAVDDNKNNSYYYYYYYYYYSRFAEVRNNRIRRLVTYTEQSNESFR